METIYESYQEMTPGELAVAYNRNINAVNVGISRMTKEHPEWKIKDGRKVTITAEGVEWLARYFRSDMLPALPDQEKIELKNEVSKLKEILKRQDDFVNKIEAAYQKNIELQLDLQKKTFLIEEKSKDQIIEMLKKENESLKKEVSELKMTLKNMSIFQFNKFKKTL